MLKSRIVDFIDSLNGAQTETDIWALTKSYFQNRGFEAVSYVDLQPGRNVLHSTLPSWWLDHYIYENYVEHDRFFDYCGPSSQPKVIGRAFAHRFEHTSVMQQKIIAEAGDAGMIAGFASTVRKMGENGMACWAIAGDMTQEQLYKRWEEEGEALNLITHLSYNAMQARLAMSATPTLSDIEQQCLRQLANGLSPKEIALRISFRPEEVYYHLAMAKQKMANQGVSSLLANQLGQRYAQK